MGHCTLKGYPSFLGRYILEVEELPSMNLLQIIQLMVAVKLHTKDSATENHRNKERRHNILL